MTNNEAAKWIQLYIDLAKIDPTTGEAAYLNDDDRKTIEAMEMAINALTAQPESHDKRTEMHACDLISRKAAIDAINEREWLTQDGKEILAEVLEQLPTAQPELTDEDMKLIKQLRSYHNGSYAKVIDKLLAVASAQPELIRCKDCKHWQGEKRGYFYYFEQCSLHECTASSDDFCSCAERREE